MQLIVVMATQLYDKIKTSRTQIRRDLNIWKETIHSYQGPFVFHKYACCVCVVFWSLSCIDEKQYLWNPVFELQFNGYLYCKRALPDPGSSRNPHTYFLHYCTFHSALDNNHLKYSKSGSISIIIPLSTFHFNLIYEYSITIYL